MIIQEIVDGIIEQIKAQISPLLGGASVQGNGLVIQAPNGAVVSITADKFGERKDFTISDNKTPRFYIRLLQEMTARRLEGAQRLGSCGGRQITANCRLVFMAHCKDAQKLLLALQSILFNLHLPVKDFEFGAKKVDLLDRSSSYLPWDIFNKETLKPKKEFHASSLQLVSIDFSIVTVTNYNFCEEINLC
jgi:hypothetical protein